jgi:hypothetical protein
MKKAILSLQKIGVTLAILLMTSCTDECAECHVVADIDGNEYELMELGEHCEEELHDIEEEGYTIEDTILVDIDGNNLPSPVLPGDAVEVHCGEEHDH